MSEEQKAWGRVGGVAALVAVLAFFGINSFEDLRKTVGSASATTEACDRAGEAVGWRAEAAELGYAADRGYARRIRSAAKLADDDELKDSLQDNADAAALIGDLKARELNVPNSLQHKESDAYNRWVAVCNS